AERLPHDAAADVELVGELELAGESLPRRELPGEDPAREPLLELVVERHRQRAIEGRARRPGRPVGQMCGHLLRSRFQRRAGGASAGPPHSRTRKYRTASRERCSGRGPAFAPRRAPARWLGSPGEPQARRLRAGGGARRGPRRALRRGRGPDRRVRALLVVCVRDGDVPRAPGREPGDRRGGGGGAGGGAPARDGVPGRAAGRGRRGAPRRASVRGAGVRCLPAPVKAILHTDGGARGNPGPAAFAYVLEGADGTVLAAHGETIGVATNNVAEYRGLVAGLAKALELSVSE